MARLTDEELTKLVADRREALKAEKLKLTARIAEIDVTLKQLGEPPLKPVFAYPPGVRGIGAAVGPAAVGHNIIGEPASGREAPAQDAFPPSTAQEATDSTGGPESVPSEPIKRVVTGAHKAVRIEPDLGVPAYLDRSHPDCVVRAAATPEAGA